MRQEFKVLMGIGVLAVGAGAWYIGSHYASGGKPQQATTENKPQIVSPIADPETLAVSHDTEAEPIRESHAMPASSADVHTGELASPPPIGVAAEERSFRPPAIGGTQVRPAPALPEVSSPVAVEPPPASPITPQAPVSQLDSDASADEVHKALSEMSEPAPAVEPAATRPAEAAATPAVREHVIQPGETYSALAVKYYGAEKYAAMIAKANPGKDPRRLYVGAKIKIPPAPATASAAPAGAPATPGVPPALAVKTPAARPPVAKADAAPPIPEGHAYKVQEREGWYDLARRFLGDGNRWPELFELNKERVSHNPNALRAGTVIEVPKKLATTKPS